MKDLAEDTFLNKWPDWIRWFCFLPVAIIIPLIIIFIQNLTIKWFIGIEGKSVMLDLMADFYLGAGSVGIGAMVAPKKQFLISIILLVILTIFSIMSFIGSLISPQPINTFEAFLHSIVVTGSGVYVVYSFHKEEVKKINNHMG